MEDAGQYSSVLQWSPNWPGNNSTCNHPISSLLKNIPWKQCSGEFLFPVGILNSKTACGVWHYAHKMFLFWVSRFLKDKFLGFLSFWWKVYEEVGSLCIKWLFKNFCHMKNNEIFMSTHINFRFKNQNVRRISLMCFENGIAYFSGNINLDICLKIQLNICCLSALRRFILLQKLWIFLYFCYLTFKQL